MGLITKLLALCALLSPLAFYLFINDRLFPEGNPADYVPKKQWFGPGKNPVPLPVVSKPFKIAIPEKEIELLKQQLALDINRLAKPIQNTGFTYGFNSDYLKHMISYWKEDFDWRKVSSD